MELTKETFEDFLKRLKHHNIGEGVNSHCTANPIFIVQRLNRVFGIDFDYDPKHVWVDSDDHDTELTDEELVEALEEYKEEGGAWDEFDIKYDTEVLNGDESLYRKVGYFEQWENVNAHFTKEAAEAFIKRKKHDYRQLRVFVDSQYWCQEFRAIVEGLLSGKIKYIE